MDPIVAQQGVPPPWRHQANEGEAKVRLRKASQAALLAKDQQLMDELKKALACSPACRGEVIFIDEVTFSMKTFKPYAWSHTSQSVSQTTLLGSQPCQAVVGAASASQGLIVWHVSPKSFDA